MTPEQIKNLDVYSEEFQNLFYPLLQKFVADFDDMAQMDIIHKAKELLTAINEA